MSTGIHSLFLSLDAIIFVADERTTRRNYPAAQHHRRLPERPPTNMSGVMTRRVQLLTSKSATDVCLTRSKKIFVCPRPSGQTSSCFCFARPFVDCSLYMRKVPAKSMPPCLHFFY
jgi:hypothetical protein